MKLIKVYAPVFQRGMGILSLLSIPLIATTLSVHASDLKIGFSEFIRQSSGLSPATSALFRLTNPEGILVSEAGVEAVSPIRRGRIFVQLGSSVQTGIALANSSEQTVSFRLTLRDESGKEIASIERFELSGHEHVARFVEQFFGGISAPFLGSLTFEGTGPSDEVGAVTIRQSQNSYNEPLLTTLPVVDLELARPAGTSLIFPQLGAGPGFATQLFLINPSSAAIVGRIHLISSDGEPLYLQLESGVASQVPFLIPANGVFLAEVSLPPGLELGVGYARVEVTQGQMPSGTAVFRFLEDQQPVSEAGVAASRPMRRARLFLDHRDTSTGFAVVNPNPISLSLHLRLYDANGSLIEQVEYPLNAKNHLSKFASEFFSLSDQFVGLLEIESDRDFVPITLKLSQNRRNESILTTLPVADLSRLDSGDLLVVPQIGSGESVVGNFDTSLIFIGPLQENAVGGWVKFWQGQGQPLELGLLGSELRYAVEAGAAGEILLADSLPEPVLSRGVTTSANIGSEGGELSLPDCDGSFVSLGVPPFALLESREIRLTCLKSRPVSTLGRGVFPGIALEPNGLFFREPVQLTIQLPKPLENPKWTTLFDFGLDNLPRAIFRAVADGQLLTADLFHFSEYWADRLNLSDLMVWADRLATPNPAERQKALELFRSQVGDLEIDDLTLELLVGLSDLNPLLEFEGLQKTVDQAPPDSVALGYLDQLVGNFLTSPVPASPCGYYHGAALRLRDLSEAFLGSNQQMTNRIAQLDSECIRVDLNGWWQSGPESGSEQCLRATDPINDGCIGHGCGSLVIDKFNESDTIDSFPFLITQSGSSFTVSFPDAPEVPPLSGHLLSTGNAEFPYSFSISTSGDDSPDCITFLQTDGSFEFGDSLCEPLIPGACKAVSCWEKQRQQGRVTSKGELLEGTDKWTLVARVHDSPGGCCSFLTSLLCRGSGRFSGTKQE